MSRVHRYGEQAQSVAFNPVGQVVGMLNEERSCRDVIQTMVEEYVDACERLNAINERA